MSSKKLQANKKLTILTNSYIATKIYGYIVFFR